MFRAVSENVDRSQDPRRTLEQLPTIISQLPSPGELVIGGKSISVMEEGGAGRLEDLGSRPPAGIAIKNRSAEDRVASTSDREDARTAGPSPNSSVAPPPATYELERLRLVLAIREKNYAFMRLVAPPIEAEAATSAVEGTVGLVEGQGQILKIQDRLVAAWTSFLRGAARPLPGPRGHALQRLESPSTPSSWQSQGPRPCGQAHSAGRSGPPATPELPPPAPSSPRE